MLGLEKFDALINEIYEKSREKELINSFSGLVKEIHKNKF